MTATTLRWVVAAITAFVVGTAGSARADTVLLAFQDTTPREDLYIHAYSGTFATMPTGAMQFNVTGGTATGFGSTLTSFCTQIFTNVYPDPTVSVPYNVVPLTGLADVQQQPRGNGVNTPAQQTAIANYLTELWGRYDQFTNTAVGAAAFQLDVWKILYDPVGSTDLTTGNLNVFGASLTDPAVALATQWLSTLTGDTTQFTNNPLYAGQELVGLASAGYQEQITIRDIPGVPAPAGLILGLLGVCTLAARVRVIRSA
ncbi:hypothetical protein [Fimbriiglobus ruber]|uniref:Uncharacterized protein n=1 Tax=Fimbriiglobus ruber TaxID=1908690 RepID=A0A225D7R5_9BACT|nr:hypothetical protein [Fimbriiglobus ruber]OWK34588.1 hypothetical protein FRUB_10559 [Fimbriiglobus ruber]